MTGIKTACITVILLTGLTDVFGQISGTLAKTDGTPVPFANVLLLKSADSTLAMGVMTTETGSYIIDRVPSGNYFLRFSAIGFKTYNTSSFTLSSEDATSRGIETMEEEPTVLNEIVIRGDKPLYELQADRTVINVQSSVMTKGSSALQVLERSPGVYIDPQNGNISMNGKNSVLIMLNGRLVRIPVNQLVAMLGGMSANDIETIELIYTPGAKYDAEGSAGMINIVTKKRDDLGTTGSFSATAGYGWREKASSNISLSHATGRVSLYGTYSFLHDQTRGGWYGYGSQNMPLFGGEITGTFWNSDKTISNSHNASAGIDVQLKDAVIGGSFLYNTSIANRDVRYAAGYTVVQNDSLWQMNSGVIGKSHWRNGMTSLYFEKTFSEGEKLNVGADYLSYQNENPIEASSFFSDASGAELPTSGGLFSTRQRGRAVSPIRVGVFKLDYGKQLDDHIRLEAGIKGTRTKSESRSTIESFENGEWIGNQVATNMIDMKETIGAVYSTITADLNASLKVVAGARYEYSDMQMTANKAENNVNRRISKLFPNVVVTRKVNERSEWQLSYTKRIGRPSYNDLASYLLYNDPMSVFTGNPTLRPTVTNNVKLGYTTSGYSFSLLASRDDHPIVRYQLSENSTHDLMYLSPQNMAYQNNLMFQTTLPLKITNWWSMSAGLNAGLRQFRITHTKQPAEKTYFAWNANGSQNFTFPHQFVLEISGWYNSFQYDGSKKVNGFGMVNAGLKKELGKNGGSLQLSVTDVFRTMRIVNTYGRLTEEAFSVISHVPYEPESARNQIVRITYFKTFGNNLAKRERTRTPASKEESDRVRKD